MTVIELDAINWTGKDEFYRDFLPAIGAPDWHGRNLDALWDTLSCDDINTVKSPFEVRIANARRSGCFDFLLKVQSIFQEAHDEGTDIQMVLE